MKDIAFDTDIKLTGGDVVIEDNTLQRLGFILEFHKGELREFPTAGLGISKQIKNSEADLKSLKRSILVELENDGFVNPEVDFAYDEKTGLKLDINV